MRTPKTIIVQSTTGRHQATLQGSSWARVTKMYATMMKKNRHLTTYDVKQIKPHVAVVTIGLLSKRNPGLCCPPLPL